MEQKPLDDDFSDDLLLDLTYPSEVLPPIIRDVVELVHWQTAIQVQVIASSALMAAAAAAQGIGDVGHPPVKLPIGSNVSYVCSGPSLFFLTVSNSPATKIACDYLFIAPLLEFGVLAVNESPRAITERMCESCQPSIALIAHHPHIFGKTVPRHRVTSDAVYRLSLLQIGCWHSGNPDYDLFYQDCFSCGLHLPIDVLASLLFSRNRKLSWWTNMLWQRSLVILPGDQPLYANSPAELLAEPRIRAFNDEVRVMLGVAQKRKFRDVFAEPYFIIDPELYEELKISLADENRPLGPPGGFLRDPASNVVKLSIVLALFSGKESSRITSMDFFEPALRIFHWHEQNAKKLHFALAEEGRRGLNWDKCLGELSTAAGDAS